ncbi:MAG: alpha/beta fold hydrolase [Pseudomonadota bacterium]
MTIARRRTAPPGGRIGFFEGADGQPLRYGLWRPQDRPIRASIVFLNGRSEFIEKHFETYADLLDRGFAVATMDWRGQGLSGRGTGDPHKDHQADFSYRRADLDRFCHTVVAEKMPPPYYALAHSLGAHLLLHVLHDRPGFFAKAAALAPMVGIKLVPLPPWLMDVLLALAGWAGLGRVYMPGQRPYGPHRRSAERAGHLTSDLARFADEHAAIDLNPALAMGGVTYGWLKAARRSTRRLLSPGFAEAIETPLLILLAGADPVVDNDRVRAFAARLPHARVATIAGARHELLKERDALRGEAMGHLMRFFKAVD